MRALTNQRLRCLSIRNSDGSQRKHKLVVEFPPGYPAVPLKLDPMEVPKCDFDQRWEERGMTFSIGEGTELTLATKQAEKVNIGDTFILYEA